MKRNKANTIGSKKTSILLKGNETLLLTAICARIFSSSIKCVIKFNFDNDTLFGDVNCNPQSILYASFLEVCF